jgi:hypothetical protein
VTSRIRTVSLLAASLLALTACGTGTESLDSAGTAGNTSGGDSRNTALADDDGKPFAGISNTYRYVAVNPADRGVWLGAQGGVFAGTGTVTGGAAVFSTSEMAALDPRFPRVNGVVKESVFDQVSGDIAIAGSFNSVGTARGMERTHGLAIVGVQGDVRGTNLKMEAYPSSIARTGRLLFVAGRSTWAYDQNTGVQLNQIGLHRVDATNSRFLAQKSVAVLRDTNVARTIAIGKAVTADRIMMAMTTADDARQNSASLHIVNVQTGEVVTTLIRDKAEITLRAVENGWATVQLPGEPLRLLDIDNARFTAAYAPANNTVLSVHAGDGRIRVMRTDNGTQLSYLTDLDPRTLAATASVAYPTPQRIVSIKWAGPDRTMIDSRMFIHATGQTVEVLPYGSVLHARSLGARALLVGGIFPSVLNGERNNVLRIPDDWNTANSTGFGAGQPEVLAMTSTPQGVVAVTARNEVVLFGRDTSVRPTTIATFDMQNVCQRRYYDVEMAGNSLMLSGCWATLNVGGVATTDRVVELNISGARPSIVRTYPFVHEIPGQVAATSEFVFVTAESPVRLLAVHSRVGRRLITTVPYDQTPSDMAAFLYATDDAVASYVIAVGSNLGTAGEQSRFPVIAHAVNSADPTRVLSLALPSITSGNVTAVELVDSRPDGGEQITIHLAGLMQTGNGYRHLASVDFFTEELTTYDTMFNYMPDGLSVDGDRMWVSGYFTGATSAGRSWKAPGVFGINLTTNEVLRSGGLIQPVVTTTTDAPAPTAPPTTVTQPPAPTDDVETPAGPPVGPTPPPELPATGDAEAGTYSVESTSGVRSEVAVGADGSLTITPAPGTATADMPAIVRLKPVSRGMTVVWNQVPGRYSYTVSTGSGRAKRTCTSSKSSCTVKNLDPWKTHVFTVQAVRNRSKLRSEPSPGLRTFVKVPKGSSTKVSSIAPQPKKGKATWTTAAPCSVKAGKLVAPKKAGRCVLRVKVGTAVRTVNVRAS